MHHNVISFFSSQHEIPIVLAADIFELIGPLAIGLIYAFTAWVKKQNEKKKRSNLDRSNKTSTPPVINTPSQQSSGGWMEKLEQMVEEAQLERVNDQTEFNTSSFEGDYEDNLPPLISEQSEIINTDPEPERVFSEVTIEDPVEKTKSTDHSPVYKSPIYNSNIAREIGNNIDAARQGVISAIILNPPRSLEDPDKITRY